jgi:short subunit dehydrogenase-like uncharacterized protein
MSGGSSQRAKVLVHGATGFTGRLVCAALQRTGVAFDIAGRNRDKLEALAQTLPPHVGASSGLPAVNVVDVTSSTSLREALQGRCVVAACAGPFSALGERLIEAAAHDGVTYVDTCGEQSFVAHAFATYQAAARASGACIVPSMAYEVALADWMAHIATERLEGAVERVSICYSHGASFVANASRATVLSSLGELGDPNARQLVDGELRREAPLAQTRRFAVLHDDGTVREVTGVSFPSPEAVVVASHTGARTVRTFLAVPAWRGRGLVAGRSLVPALARAGRALIERFDASVRSAERDPRASRFEVIVEASRGGVSALARARGTDPYAVTATIQAFAIQEILAGRVTAKGVVAPSVAFAADAGLAALTKQGVTFEVTERSRER